MAQERRVILAALLSSFMMVWYLHAFGRTPPQPSPAKEVAQPNPSPPDVIKLQPAVEEKVIVIESDDLKLEIGTTSAGVRKVVLKRFQRLSTGQPLEFGAGYPIVLVQVGSSVNAWQLKSSSQRDARWIYEKDSLLQELTISLGERGPTLSIEATVVNRSGSDQLIPVSIVASFGRGDDLNGRGNPLECVLLTEKQLPWQRTYLRYFGSRAQINVPRGTDMATLTERYFCHSIKPSIVPVTASVLPLGAEHISASLSGSILVKPGSQETFLATSYIGPRDFFKLRDAGFEKALDLGLLAKIGLGLMLFLNWIASITHSYGAAVILFAVIITVGMSPFTLISFRSMRKMRELQPRIDQIKKKYAKDPKRLNQETMLLFKENRVSPLSGCLPLLIQIPIFFSIWSAISHVIEIRGQSFLWISDLSLPDRLAKIPPGIDLNLLPILMAVAMFFQTKLSQQQVPQSGTNEMAKIMSGPIMPIMFGVMFYNLPSCLVLYWLTNSLTTLAFYRLAKT
jgi:YidC/Oxa1 family membrane protein insertase